MFYTSKRLQYSFSMIENCPDKISDNLTFGWKNWILVGILPAVKSDFHWVEFCTCSDIFHQNCVATKVESGSTFLVTLKILLLVQNSV